ncbi:MAG TPA: RNA ligase family protein, partial [Thermoplasmata archaeon]|nr:RNA ligase family protein [Thermoplasmata archaeon]
LKAAIPRGHSVFAEWCYATHSIRYSALPDFLLVIAAREDFSGQWLSWSGTARLAAGLGIPAVPELWRGTPMDQNALRAASDRVALSTSECGGDREGLVVRLAGPFKELPKSMAKWVRAGHVTTDEHWTRAKIEKNALAIRYSGMPVQ